jgi:hypothetical protein
MCAANQLLCESVSTTPPESVLISLAQALLRTDPNATFAMINSYTFYGDAAGGSDQGFIVVAGYLSTYQKWLEFIGEWTVLLGAYGLPYFHMAEFAHFKGPFDQFKDDEGRRSEFLSKAASLIRDHVERSFACRVEFASFSRVSRAYPLAEIAGVPYSCAARTCVTKVRKSLPRGTDVEFVFEDGDKGKGELIRIMERDGYPIPIFRPSRDRVVKGHMVKALLPLQAADFAAYELRKAFKDDPCELWPVERYRRSLRALADIPSGPADWAAYREKELTELCTTFRGF